MSPPTSSVDPSPIRPDRQAAPRRHPHVLRLADQRRRHGFQPGQLGTRPQARRQAGQDARAHRRRGQAAPRQHHPREEEPDGTENGDDDAEEEEPPKPTIAQLRDRALIAVMVFSFARVSAALAMKVEDYYTEGRRAWFRLHEKGGKRHKVPAHHNAEKYVDAYLDAAGIAGQKKTPLFRSIDTHRKLTDRPMDRNDALRMIKRRAKAAGLSEDICCHTFRATGITAYLEGGGTIEHAQADRQPRIAQDDQALRPHQRPDRPRRDREDQDLNALRGLDHDRRKCPVYSFRRFPVMAALEKHWRAQRSRHFHMVAHSLDRTLFREWTLCRPHPFLIRKICSRLSKRRRSSFLPLPSSSFQPGNLLFHALQRGAESSKSFIGKNSRT